MRGVFPRVCRECGLLASVSSALVLPRIDEDARVELSVYEGSVWVLRLEIRFVESLPELTSFVENIITVEVLICGLREIVCVQARRVLAHLILDHSVVKVVCISTVSPQIVANKVLSFAWGTVRQSTILEVIVLISCITVPKNLRLCTEVLF